MKPVQDYISQQTDPARSAITHVYDVARQLVPDTTETISYSMPCLKYNGKILLSVMNTKHHLAIYPFSGWVVSEVSARLDEGGFEYSTGTIRFQADHPLPDDLITEIVLTRQHEIDAKTKKS